MRDAIVITGIGMVTPLGNDDGEVLRRVKAGECAAKQPADFAADAFACPVCAAITDFHAPDYVSELKTIRLMNREAQLAVAAARLALRDANLTVGREYLAEDIGLFGATGLAGLPLPEVMPLIRASSAADGRFDVTRFGGAGLKAVSPILSFKILGNMPICFVAINEGIKGANAIFTPWEGQGAQTIECGVRALRNWQARCALVGGCDVKTHELSFLSLEQQGVFDSWRTTGSGAIPGEGSVFLVLEKESDASVRGAKAYARLTGMALRTLGLGTNHVSDYGELFKQTAAIGQRFRSIISAANGDTSHQRDEEAALCETRITGESTLAPKKHTGDLFAAAAFLQVALAAQAVHQFGGRTLANCLGHGTEQAVFVLEKP
jgi:3-oxoacyl-[acyl-carrier-protein] synthase II